MVKSFVLLLFVTLAILDVFVIKNYELAQYTKKEETLVMEANGAADIVRSNFSDMLKLNEAARVFSKETEGRLLIVDTSAKVLVDEEIILFGQHLASEWIEDAKKNAGPLIRYGPEGTKQIVNVMEPVIYKGKIIGIVVISADVMNVHNDVERFGRFVLAISGISMILAGFVAFYIGERISKPIKQLHQAVKEMQSGNYKVNVGIEGKNEIAELSEAFNGMSKRIDIVNEKKDSFISDVSHELKTPLTSVKAMIEGLLFVEEDFNLYKEYLTDMNGEIDRLNNLVNKLLHDSRISEISIVKEELSLIDLIQPIIRHLSREIAEKGVTVDYESLYGVFIQGDQLLFQELLINLIHNGVKYGKVNGALTISYTTKPQKTLSFKDDGIGIGEKDLPYIFDLFYRSDDSRSRDTGGTGVGLNIVKRVVDAHGWKINVESALKEGTIFRIIMD